MRLLWLASTPRIPLVAFLMVRKIQIRSFPHFKYDFGQQVYIATDFNGASALPRLPCFLKTVDPCVVIGQSLRSWFRRWLLHVSAHRSRPNANQAKCTFHIFILFYKSSSARSENVSNPDTQIFQLRLLLNSNRYILCRKFVHS